MVNDLDMQSLGIKATLRDVREKAHRDAKPGSLPCTCRAGAGNPSPYEELWATPNALDRFPALAANRGER